jgi:hypothetical protein
VAPSVSDPLLVPQGFMAMPDMPVVGSEDIMVCDCKIRGNQF